MNKFLFVLLILTVYKVSSQNLDDLLSNLNQNTDLTEGSGMKSPYVETVPYTPEQLEQIIAEAIQKIEEHEEKLQERLEALNSTVNG